MAAPINSDVLSLIVKQLQFISGEISTLKHVQHQHQDQIQFQVEANAEERQQQLDALRTKLSLREYGIDKRLVAIEASVKLAARLSMDKAHSAVTTAQNGTLSAGRAPPSKRTHGGVSSSIRSLSETLVIECDGITGAATKKRKRSRKAAANTSGAESPANAARRRQLPHLQRRLYHLTLLRQLPLLVPA